MPYLKSEKLKAIDALLKARRTALKIELDLRFQGEDEQAERMWEAATRLGSEIDFLIGRALDEWAAAAAQVAARLGEGQAALDAATRDIKRKIAVAEKVASAVGVLDKLTTLARKIVGGL